MMNDTRKAKRSFLATTRGSAATTAALLAPFAPSRYAWSAGEVSGQVTVWYFPFGPNVETHYQTFKKEFEQQHELSRVAGARSAGLDAEPGLYGGSGPDGGAAFPHRGSQAGLARPGGGI